MSVARRDSISARMRASSSTLSRSASRKVSGKCLWGGHNDQLVETVVPVRPLDTFDPYSVGVGERSKHAFYPLLPGLSLLLRHFHHTAYISSSTSAWRSLVTIRSVLYRAAPLGGPRRGPESLPSGADTCYGRCTIADCKPGRSSSRALLAMNRPTTDAARSGDPRSANPRITTARSAGACGPITGGCGDRTGCREIRPCSRTRDRRVRSRRSEASMFFT